MTEIELPFAFLTWDNQFLITIRYKDNIEVGIEEANLLVDKILSLVNNRRFSVLSNATDVASSMDASARRYIAEHEEVNNLVDAHAIVVNGLSVRIIAQFYINLNKRSHPRKIFSSLKDAEDWIIQYN